MGQRLKRPLHPMPENVKEAHERYKFTYAYISRSPYQRNDYIGWINRATILLIALYAFIQRIVKYSRRKLLRYTLLRPTVVR
jgi:hypothetical protein